MVFRRINIIEVDHHGNTFWHEHVSRCDVFDQNYSFCSSYYSIATPAQANCTLYFWNITLFCRQTVVESQLVAHSAPSQTEQARCVRAHRTFSYSLVRIEKERRADSRWKRRHLLSQRLFYQIFARRHNQNKKLDFKMVQRFLFYFLFCFCLSFHPRVLGGYLRRCQWNPTLTDRPSAYVQIFANSSFQRVQI